MRVSVLWNAASWSGLLGEQIAIDDNDVSVMLGEHARSQ